MDFNQVCLSITDQNCLICTHISAVFLHKRRNHCRGEHFRNKDAMCRVSICDSYSSIATCVCISPLVYANCSIIKTGQYLICRIPSIVREFSEPSEMTDVCLVVENKQFHVSRVVIFHSKFSNITTDYRQIFQILAQHSPVFKKMFYGSFEENGKEEIQLKDVRHEVSNINFANIIAFANFQDFLYLLNVIYTSTREINGSILFALLNRNENKYNYNHN